jgi:predicted metalloendopeptidase
MFQRLSVLLGFVLSLVCFTAFSQELIIDLKAIDTSVNPCEDFYHYACGNWIKNFPLPSDRASYNRQTDGLSEEILAKLNTILAEYSKGQQKVKAKYAKELGDYYGSCMDTRTIAQKTPAFVQAQMKLIDDIQNPRTLAETVAQLHLQGVSAFFNFGSQIDLDNSNVVISSLFQGGMSFQDKSYYFKKDAKSLEILNHFLKHVQNVFELAGESKAQALADAKLVLSFETHLADKALATEDLQDSTALNHPMNPEGVTHLTPEFEWADYFAALKIKTPAKINVATLEFFPAMSGLLKSTPLKDLKVYLKWQALHAYAGSLSEPFRAENFSFWKSYMSGVKNTSPRWKECTRTLESNMTEALGEAFVNSFPDPSAIKNQTALMILEIKQAFGANLESLDWLDIQTRDAAKRKLELVSDKVGFPAHWQSFDGLVIRADDFISNTRNAANFAVRKDLNKIGLPTDRSLWEMPAWEQNAYYNPSANEMVFPLGALVPPIFDLKASAGANFGSIGGGWMGHELTHGFDSDGRHFDGHGNLANWWTEDTAKQFDQRSQCLIQQADHYEVLPNLFVRGQQTLTENLADQGGVKVGYQAWLKGSQGHAPAPNLGPFNEAQQYWVAYAQSWCTKETPEKLAERVATDVHPPAEFRTNAVLFNRPEFAVDFACKAGSRMAPVNRCSVW